MVFSKAHTQKFASFEGNFQNIFPDFGQVFVKLK